MLTSEDMDWAERICKRGINGLLDECNGLLLQEKCTVATKNEYEEVKFTGILSRKSMIWARESIQKIPIKMTLTNIGLFVLFLSILMPRTFTYILIYPTFRLVLGNLYPAYSSYKAVRTKNVKEYVSYFYIFSSFHIISGIIFIQICNSCNNVEQFQVTKLIFFISFNSQ